MERPLLEEMERRSTLDWGLPPHYNAEYRRIRWPRNIPQPLVVNGRETQEMRSGTPLWKLSIRDMRAKKSNGNWNRGRSYAKDDTKTHLKIDLLTCMRENIPFKTRTFEYKPSTQCVYVNGIVAFYYDLSRGRITHFSYSGVYNKVTSLLFRIFNIPVKLKNKKLVIETRARIYINFPYSWLDMNTGEVDLNRIYEIPNGILVNSLLERERTTVGII